MGQDGDVKLQEFSSSTCADLAYELVEHRAPWLCWAVGAPPLVSMSWGLTTMLFCNLLGMEQVSSSSGGSIGLHSSGDSAVHHLPPTAAYCWGDSSVRSSDASEQGFRGSETQAGNECCHMRKLL